MFLVDGLDEIASRPDAVAEIYGELRSGTFNWIATSRQAGLISDPNEKRRFQLAGLDAERIETLIRKWISVTMVDSENVEINLIADNLIVEIMNSPSMLRMARNPFLLTAFIFLKSMNPDKGLPITKIGIYEALADNIVNYTRNHPTKNLLSTQGLEALEQFSFSQFNSDNGLKHYFTDSDWDSFFKDEKLNALLDQEILPARLVGRQPEPFLQYHFIHLSLQEYFVARDMLKKEVESVIDKKDIYGWKHAFILYGALLNHRKEYDKFRILVDTIFKRHDLAGFQLILLAEMFAACGIKNTRPWIGKDLRKLLFSFSHTDFSDHHYFIISAIAELDSEWLENKSIEMARKEVVSQADGAVGDDLFENYSFSLMDDDTDNPYWVLYKARTRSAKEFLKSIFYGDDQKHALMASKLFAYLSTDLDRRNLVERVINLEMDDPLFLRAYCFAEGARSPACLPVFFKCARSWWLNDPDLRESLLQGIIDAGGVGSNKFLCELIKEIYQEGRSNHILKDLLMALGQTGNARDFEDLEQWNKDINFRKTVAETKLESGLIHDLTEFDLRDEVLLEKAISGLEKAAGVGNVPDRPTPAVLDKLSPKRLVPFLGQLACIENASMFYGSTVSLNPLIARICRFGCSCTFDNKIEKKEFLQGLAEALLVFSYAEYLDVEDLTDYVVENHDGTPELLEGTICLLGLIHKGTKNKGVIKLLDGLLQNPSLDLEHDIYHAIARISPDKIFEHRGTPFGDDAIQMLAANHGWLLFDDHWTDEFGTKNAYDSIISSKQA